jgi:hypothetical protein
VEDLRQHSSEWERTIPYLRGLIAEHTGREIPIAVTEVNTHYTPAIGGEATPDSHYNAVWVAEMFGRLINQDVFMVNHWMLTSHGGQGGWGLIGRGELRPSYYVYQIFSKFGSQQVYAASGVEDVSLYAARRDDGALTVIAINLADSEKQAALQVSGAAPTGAELWRLDQENNPETATDFTFSGDDQVSLPAQSISFFFFPPAD